MKLLSSRWANFSEQRVAILMAFAVVWVMAIGLKLIRLQVKDHDWLREKAERQHQAFIELSPVRGRIYDRNGYELARSVEVSSLYASPSMIREPDQLADQLSRLLGIEREVLLRRLTSNQVLVAVKRKLTDEEASAVRALNLPGLRLVNEMKRFYINGSTASHVLGFVDVDERGMGGIELSYDKLIRGRGGRLVLSVDALKNTYDHGMEGFTPGADVVLTIDTLIQHRVEQLLSQAVRSSHARGGTVIVMRPTTGEILALANYPSFNANHISESGEEQLRNRAIETAFEPGSVFKIVTYAAALEEKLIKPNTLIDCGGGQIRIADRIVHDGHYGVLTAAQALAKSSNVAAIRIGQRLGDERLASYIERFGFGRRTGIELPGESRGLLRDVSNWQATSIGSIPIGHEIGVTAMQVVAAFGCIANGGEWVQPYLVSRVVSPEGEVIEEHHRLTRRVVSEATATTLKSMLEGVVIHGTGRLASISGYRAAGKTGTAQKIDEATGRYSNTRYVASFAGFAPVDNPEVVCVVSIDEPKGAHHGGDVAAPVFARVVAEALRLLGVAPEDDPGSRFFVEDFRVYDIPRVIVEAENDSTGCKTCDDRPALDIASTGTQSPAARASVVVPDLRGCGVREAVSLCLERRLRIKATGEGIVIRQIPSPGALVAEGTECYVSLSKTTADRVQGREGETR
jgi:cell division protein FtsI/penicillin-binding protein 2